jgi:hypothetical protein
MKTPEDTVMILLFYHILMLFQQHNANRNQFVTQGA